MEARKDRRGSKRRVALERFAVLAPAFVAFAAFAPVDDPVFQPKLPDAGAIVRSIRERVQTRGEEAVVFLLDEHLFGETPAAVHASLFDSGPKAPADPGPANTWLKAIHENFDHGKLAVRVGRRTEPQRSIALERAASANSIQDDKTTPDCKDGFEWAEKCAGEIQATFAKRSAVVFVTDRPARVTWTRAPEQLAEREACWSQTWHEEEVGRTLARCGAELIVVAPEAAFGEDTPVSLARFLPWASRPVAAGRGQVYAFMNTSALEDVSTSDLSPELRVLSRLKSWPRFEGELPDTLDAVDPERPDFLRSLESDIPTGFGGWEYARACQITHGAFYSFPRPHTDWLDPCRRSDLARALVPVLDRPAAAQWNEQRNEPLAQATRKAVRRALDRSERLWKSNPFFPYCELPPLLRKQRDRDGAKAPFELLSDKFPGQLELKQWREFAKTLPRVVAEYDACADELETAIESTRAAPSGDLHPSRAVADAMLTAYWLRTSAFHLAQLEEIAARPEDVLFAPRENVQYSLVSVTAVRMSELLNAYDGAIVDPPLDVSRFASRGLLPPDVQRFRDCRLILDPVDPLFRAQRYPPYATQLLSPAAVERVTKIVVGARRIHERFSQTPWDWMVYYDELQTFEFVFYPPSPSPNPSPGEPKPEATPPFDLTPLQPPVDTTPDPLGPSTSGD